MMRLAGPRDAAALDRFLTPYTETSMFLRSNLAASGTQDRKGPFGTRFFLWEECGAIAGVFGLTNRGYLMVQAPDVPMAAYRSFADAIAGGTVVGITGDTPQAKRVFDALGLAQHATSLSHDEPLYRLDLAQLAPSTAHIRPAQTADAPMLERWFYEYEIDTGIAAKQADTTRSKARAAAAVGGDVRLLEVEGTSVAIAAVNAAVGDYIQIGGVFVDRAHRGKGYGGAVTAALLHEWRGKGAKTAILFANNPIAAAAYERIGFTQIGTYHISLLVEPAQIQGAST